VKRFRINRRFIGPKRGALLIILAVGATFAWQLHRSGSLNPSTLRVFLAGHPVSAPIAFVIAYAASVVALLPTGPLNLAAGLFWGPIWGGILSAIGAGTGSVVAFYAARMLFGQPLARRFDYWLISAVQDELSTKGWRFVMFARLNPVFPTGPMNYLFGLTAIDAMAYVWATFAFLLPPSILVAAIGYAMGDLADDGMTRTGLRAVVIISAAVTGLYAIRLVSRLLEHRQAQRD
jgi:uncharacterized membrane protein YdjX (TVP38/TMEM64 family)